MLRSLFKLLFLLTFGFHSLYALDDNIIPPDLQEWKAWVLDEVKTYECPIDYQQNRPECLWYNRLSVSLTPKQLDFQLNVTLYQDQTAVKLPSTHQSWVQNITVNGEKGIVIGANEQPKLLLDKGEYHIEGSIPWRDDLKSLQLPKNVALVTLQRDHQPVVNPKIDPNGRLWLDQNGTAEAEQGSVAVSLYRKLIDGHPMRMESYLQFRVSGEMRSVVLDGVLAEGFLPTAIESKLDASMTDDQKLKVELKAGEWTVVVDSYTPEPMTQFQKPKGQFVYDNEEIWSVVTDANYRSIEIEGVQAVDPSQTTLPEGWKALPAYLVQEGDTLTVKELYKSAAQQQKSELKLNREMWLDFDGTGYSIDDRIEAKIAHVRRLEATPLLDLASASINRQPALITTLEGHSQKGIELREQHMNIKASSRYEGEIAVLPANGWNEPFNAISTTVHFPPGWELFAAFGSDNQTTAWLERWNLMDIFLVLLLSIAIYQLYGWRWALPATLFVILLWHEQDAPTVIWLFMVMLAALLRVLNKGGLKRAVQTITGVVVVTALFQVLNFTVYEIRTALYPQLENEYDMVYYEDEGMYDAGVLPSSIPLPSESMNRMYEEEQMVQQKAYIPQQKELSKSYSKMMQNRVDPNAVVQTGIGKPQWKWQSHDFEWQSGVGSEDRLELWLIAPWLTKVLKITHIIGMLFLLYLFIHPLIPSIVPKWKQKLALSKTMAVAMIALLGLVVPQKSFADIPSPELLESFKSRLIEVPSCLPNCADMNEVTVQIDKSTLTVTMHISAATDLAVPLLGNRTIWLPKQVTIDGKENAELRLDESGGLWTKLTKGVHTIILQGTLQGQNQLMLTSRLPLHNVTLASANNSWKITSDHKSYIEINSLQYQEEQTQAQNRIEPLVEVTRTFYFGQLWYIDTEVRLLNSIEKPYSLRYPLLTDESILDKEIEAKNGQAVVHLSDKQSRYQWRSSLPITPNLTLQAMSNPHVVEIWQMDISSIWDMGYQGIEPIEQVTDRDIIMPRFKPWQEEQLTLNLARTQAVKGENLTIESSKVEITQSTRYRDVQLTLDLKSSQAGQYTIQLDNITELKPTTIDGRTHYLKINNGTVALPLQAKSQKVILRWKEDLETHTVYDFPMIDLKKASTNNTLELSLPEQRWILWTNGPTLGPAVLLWGVLVALLLVAVVLGKLLGSPLKTRDWLLLGLGVSTTSVFILVPIVIWIGALRYREYRGDALQGWRRNMTQIGLGMLTIIALGTIVGAVSAGLLGNPDMMIVGNQSYGNYLNWYSDRLLNTLPEPTVMSVSIWYYRALMLVWSIWVAFALIRWLKWTWTVFSQGEIWVKWRSKKVEVIEVESKN